MKCENAKMTPKIEEYREFTYDGKTWKPYVVWHVGSRSCDTYPSVWEHGPWRLTLLHQYEYKYGGENGKHWRIDKTENGRTVVSAGPITLEMALDTVG